jgi:hypothetical protein
MTMSAKTKTHTAHFTVDGRGITGLIRTLYCFEDNKEGAMGILSSFDGMTEEQKIKICTGDAHLEDMNADGTMQYVEMSEPDFKHEYHKFLMDREIRARKIKEAEEEEWERVKEAAEKNHISPDTQQWVNEQNPYHEANVARDRLSARGREMYDAGLELTLKDGTKVQRDPNDVLTPHADALLKSFNNFLESNGKKLAAPSKETIRVGRWDVPKNYLDRYANFVVKRIRGLIRMQCAGAVSVGMLDPMSTYNLEMERQNLHNAICDAIGVPHSDLGTERTQDQADFDKALDAYLDEHAGKLFNGDE